MSVFTHRLSDAHGDGWNSWKGKEVECTTAEAHREAIVAFLICNFEEERFDISFGLPRPFARIDLLVILPNSRKLADWSSVSRQYYSQRLTLFPRDGRDPRRDFQD